MCCPCCNGVSVEPEDGAGPSDVTYAQVNVKSKKAKRQGKVYANMPLVFSPL